MKEELQKLIEQYGADAVAKAAAEALNKHVPTINTPVVTDEQLINTISQLDAAVTDILEAGRKNEETYQNKVELARRARQLETSIQITEAEAINTICGTGKDAYGIIPYPDGTHVRVAVTNDTQRDAFRRHFSAAERKELASVEADIKAIEVSQFKTREDLDAKKEALSCIRAKAQLQAAALTYLRNEKQAERRQRGEDFQEECRRSWRQIPNLWRLRITDGGNLGTRPADELVLLEHVNLLCEEKRTDGDQFKLSMLRTDQLTGLINFEKALDRNIGLSWYLSLTKL